MHQTIVNLAKQMPACANVGITLLDAFCTAAQAELERRLLPEITPESLGERFACAAAMLAASMCASASDGGEEALRAGNVSVSRRSGGMSAKALRAEAFGMLAGSVALDGFAFLGVDCDLTTSE